MSERPDWLGPEWIYTDQSGAMVDRCLCGARTVHAAYLRPLGIVGWEWCDDDKCTEFARERIDRHSQEEALWRECDV